MASKEKSVHSLIGFKERCSKRIDVALFIPKTEKTNYCGYDKDTSPKYLPHKQLESLMNFKLGKISQFILRKRV